MSEQRQQLIEDLKALLEQDVTAIKDQVEHLKTQFYRAASEASETIDEKAEEVSGEVNET